MSLRIAATVEWGSSLLEQRIKVVNPTHKSVFEYQEIPFPFYFRMMTLLTHYVLAFSFLAMTLALPTNNEDNLGKRADADYVRFGKRADADYVRFGKRADADYVRFGKRADSDYVRFGKRSPEDFLSLLQVRYSRRIF